jgi:predicted TIM-barrel fold metal-dependent hydrolase
LYEKAQDLDMPVIVHLGCALRRAGAPVGKLIPSPAAIVDHIYPVLSGFFSVIASDFHTRFPGLRFGFVEAGSTWAPGVLQLQARMAASQSPDRFLEIRTFTPEELEARNVFITCESDEDLAYLTKVLGENVLCTGTDYPHNDAGGELGAHESILGRTDITTTAARKIVDTNGRKLFGIPADHTPADTAALGGDLHIRSARDGGRALVHAVTPSRG